VSATRAARDAANKREFANLVGHECGHELRIISGEEEAKLIGRGIQCDPKLHDLRDFTLVDLGGGSMERIVFNDGEATHAKSLQLGAVRLSNLFVSDRDLPLPENERSIIEKHVLDSLDSNEMSSEESSSNIAVLTGGCSTLIAARLLDENDDGITLSQLFVYRDAIIAIDKPERISKLSVPEARADIMPTAAIILSCVLQQLGCQDLRFSNYNLRFGVARTMLFDEAIS